MEETESTGTGTGTGTSVEETDQLCGHPTRDTLAEGLMGLLKPTVDRLDECVRTTRISQVELKQELESVLDDLKKITESQKTPPKFDQYLKKLVSIKQSITVTSAILQSSQDRLNKIHQMTAKESTRLVTMLNNDAPVPSTSNTDEESGNAA